MPIGGFIVNCQAQSLTDTEARLKQMEGVDVYAHDEKGRIVTVIDSPDSNQLEQRVAEIEQLPQVMHVGAAYMHMEDEINQLDEGELVPEIRFGRRQSQQQ